MPEAMASVTARPRLLIAAKGFFPVIGGVETVVRDIAEACREDFAVTVLVVNDQRRSERSEFEGYEIIKVGKLAKVFSAPLSLGFVPRFRELARQADIINLHSPYPLGELAMIQSGRSAPVVNTYHFDIVRQRVVAPLYNPLLHAVLGRADRIVVSNPNLARTSPILSRHAARVQVVPFGIDLGKYRLPPNRQERVAELRRQGTRPRVLFVGRLVYYKGVETLVRAAPEIDADITLVGNGRLETDLRALAIRLDVADRVQFVPHLPFAELIEQFHACDVFVLPSCARSEAFGLVLIEAMACGKPLVTTEIGTGPSWINRHGETGLVVPPSDPTALAEAVNQILSDPARRAAYGKAARLRAETTFTSERFAASYRDLFRGLLRSSR